jgi:hypothetical protein
MGSRSERNLDLYRRSVSSCSSILAIRAIGSVRTISTGRGIIRVYGAHASTHAIDSIGAVKAIGAAATGEAR